MEAFDRYKQVRSGRSTGLLPFGNIPEKTTDVFETYKKGKTRLDLLSYQYYDSADYGWLILQANPQYGSLEFRIPDGAEIRIPFPLDVSLKDFQTSIDKKKNL